VLAAFQTATRPAATPAPASAAVAAPVPAAAPAPTITPMASTTLARFTSATSPPPSGLRSDAQPATPDLDALAEFVLERLRDELRDGRERLGFLLDDSY
jgi:hypothetical protein